MINAPKTSDASPEASENVRGVRHAKRMASFSDGTPNLISGNTSRNKAEVIYSSALLRDLLPEIKFGVPCENDAILFACRTPRTFSLASGLASDVLGVLIENMTFLTFPTTLNVRQLLGF